MVRSSLGEGHPEEGPEGKAVAAPPGNAPLRVEALEITDENHAKVRAWGNGLPPDAAGVVGLAEGFDKAVKLDGDEEFVQLVIEDVAGGLSDIGRSDPQVGLPLFRPASHAHGKTSQGGRCRPGYHACQVGF